MARYLKQEHAFNAFNVVTLEEFKTQLQFDEPLEAHPEDTLLQIYIKAAVAHAENKIQTALLEVKYLVTGNSFEDVLNFKKQRIKSVDSFKYKPTDYTSGDLTDVPAEMYELTTVDDFEQRITYSEAVEQPDVKETIDAVQLTVILGFDAIPEDIKTAVFLYATDMYNNRSDRPKEKISAADTLLAPYRYYPVHE